MSSLHTKWMCRKRLGMRLFGAESSVSRKRQGITQSTENTFYRQYFASLSLFPTVCCEHTSWPAPWKSCTGTLTITASIATAEIAIVWQPLTRRGHILHYGKDSRRWNASQRPSRSQGLGRREVYPAIGVLSGSSKSRVHSSETCGLITTNASRKKEKMGG